MKSRTFLRAGLIPVTAILIILLLGCVPVNASAKINAGQTRATEKSFTLDWDSVDGAAYYRFYYAQAGSSNEGQSYSDYVDLEKPGITLEDSNGKSDFSYHYMVVAYSAKGKELARSDGKTGATCPGPVTNCTADKWGKTKKGWFSIKSAQYEYMSGLKWEIWNASRTKKLKSGTTKPGSASFTANVKANQTYILRVCGYVSIDGSGNFDGPWTESVVVPQPLVKDMETAGKNSIRVSWSKVEGATKYIVYASTSPSSGYKKVRTVKGSVTSCAVSKIKGKTLVPGNYYYFKIVAVKGKVKSCSNINKAAGTMLPAA